MIGARFLDVLLSRFRAAPDPPAFAQGMTLQPGESATFDLELPPEMSAAIAGFHRAGRAIGYDHGPDHSTKGRRAALRGKSASWSMATNRYARFEISWTEKP